MSHDIRLLVKAVNDLHDATRAFFNGSGPQPSSSSQADVEIHDFLRPESVMTAYSQGGLLIEVAADQLMAFTKTLTEPIQTIAPWTCIRAVIESSTLACWLLSPRIDVSTRVKRSLAFRHEGLSQQVKYAHLLSGEADTAKVIKRIHDVEVIALQLGYSKVVDRKGKRSGIGQPMPSVTELVRQELNEEAFYRVASAMVHAHHWALLQLSFRRQSNEGLQFIENTDGEAMVRSLEIFMDPTVVSYLCYQAAVNFVKPAWYKCQLFGWDKAELGDTLDKVFDSMDIREDRRCWKDTEKRKSN